MNRVVMNRVVMNEVKKVPEWLWAPLAAALPSLLVGALRIWMHLPWLFPSLGPTIFLQIHAPEHEFVRPYNVIAGHAAGVLAAVASVMLMGAAHAPSVLLSNTLSWPRVGASALAMGLTLGLQVPLRASHAPAAATALLISLGAVALTPKDLGVIAAGVLVVAILGEGLRRLRTGR